MHLTKRWRARAAATLVTLVVSGWCAGAPAITAVSSPYPRDYGTGMNLYCTLTFSEPVTVTGNPTLGARIGSNDRFFSSSYRFSTQDPAEVTFEYRVQTGDNGSVTLTGPVVLNGGSIKGTDGADASLTFEPVVAPGVVVDSIPPATPVISGFTPASPANDEYVTFSGTADSGNRISISNDFVETFADAGGNWSATVVPRPAGTYTYEVLASDSAGNTSPKATVSVTFHRSTIAGGAPRVIRAVVPPDGFYGETFIRHEHMMSFTVIFTEPVVVTGSPKLGLYVGDLYREATLMHANGTRLSFVYTPRYGGGGPDTSDNGPLTLTGPLVLDGGTIKGEDGTDAVLTFTPIEAPGVIIDTVRPDAPVITNVTPSSPTSEQSFTISGTAEPGVSVHPYLPIAGDSRAVFADANGNWSRTYIPRPPGEYTFRLYTVDRAGNGNFSGAMSLPVNITVQPTPTGRPPITSQPVSRAAAMGSSVTFSAATSAANATYQWQYNGAPIEGATSSSLTINDVAPERAGLYAAVVSDSGSFAVSSPAILGLESTVKLLGTGSEVGSNIVHPNGNVYDQALLEGAAITLTADPGQVSRASLVDLSGDIIQIEFSGAGTLSIVLDSPSGPATAENYNQPDVAYMKGHAGLVITGANETTHVAIFSVGRVTAVNQALFREGVDYHGVADLAYVAILSSNGQFGGVWAGNANFWSTRGVTGIYAPGVRFNGPINVCEITAAEDATPVLLLGGTNEARVAGGDLLQTNGRAVQISGLTRLRFVAGSTSHGQLLPAQPCRGRLEENGVDVTAQVASP